MLRASVVVLALASVLGRPQPARAWTCARESNVLVSPPPTFAAPRNVRPTITVAEEHTYSGCSSPFCRAPRSVSLFSSPGRGRPTRAVPASVEELRTSELVTFRLTPAAPLEANRRYEIRGFDQAPAPSVTMGKLLGTFRTGSYTDDEAPAWSGVARVVPHPFFGASGPRRDPNRRGVILLDPGPAQQSPYFEAFGATPIDDHTPPANLSYVVWYAAADKPIDYGTKPFAVFAHEPHGGAADRLFVAGPENECMARAYPFPDTGRFRVGVKVVDLAGNAGTASEATLDFGGPKKKR